MEINFKVNNGDTLVLTQEKDDGKVNVVRADRQGRIDYRYGISAGDFTMLLNLYRHIKENDIKNDFINPYGKNKE